MHAKIVCGNGFSDCFTYATGEVGAFACGNMLGYRLRGVAGVGRWKIEG